MIVWRTIERFCKESGYTEDAARTKIRDGIWLEGKVWKRAPDGRVLISDEGFNQWVETGLGSGKRRPRAMKSPSPIKGENAANDSRSSPPPLIANA